MLASVFWRRTIGDKRHRLFCRINKLKKTQKTDSDQEESPTSLMNLIHYHDSRGNRNCFLCTMTLMPDRQTDITILCTPPGGELKFSPQKCAQISTQGLHVFITVSLWQEPIQTGCEQCLQYAAERGISETGSLASVMHFLQLSTIQEDCAQQPPHR